MARSGGFDERPGSVMSAASTESEKDDMWSSMLSSVASSKRLPQKSILVLGTSNLVLWITMASNSQLSKNRKKRQTDVWNGAPQADQPKVKKSSWNPWEVEGLGQEGGTGKPTKDHP